MSTSRALTLQGPFSLAVGMSMPVFPCLLCTISPLFQSAPLKKTRVAFACLVSALGGKRSPLSRWLPPLSEVTLVPGPEVEQGHSWAWKP